jgi:hypothetical protein
MQTKRERWNDLAQQLLPFMQKPGDFSKPFIPRKRLAKLYRIPERYLLMA